jgi:hypothetical protein
MDPAKLKVEKQERERQLKLVREAAEAAMRSKILAEENQKRLLHLSQSADVIELFDERLAHFLADEQIRLDWENFIACSSCLPVLSELNHVKTFVVQWILNCERGGTRLATVFKYTPEILQVESN